MYISIDMPSILIVDKTAAVKPLLVKQFVEEDLYKRAGFKSKEGFVIQTSWTIPSDNASSSYAIDLYGKTVGRAGQENKFEFPPPVDTVLYFGSCALVGRQGDAVVDLTPKQWEMAYEYLYGGFEDIGSSDEDDDEESEEDDQVAKTKDGYAKDGFVVDDDEDEEDDDYEEEVSSEEEIRPPKRVAKSKSAPKSAKTIAEQAQPHIEMVIHPEEGAYLNCSCELEEETYL